MLIIGHRGAAGTWPENTLLSIRHALEYGVDWVEIDVRLVDGSVIVLHDETLDRTTNACGSVYSYSIDALRQFDAGLGESIPLLVEVLEMIDARVGLNIEIKQSGIDDVLLDIVESHLRKQPAWKNRLMMSSFLPDVMPKLSKRVPDGCLLGALGDGVAEDLIEIAADFNMYSVNVSLAQLSDLLVEKCHAQQLKLLVYTVNTADELRRCQHFSVDGIFTDYPERAIALLAPSATSRDHLR